MGCLLWVQRATYWVNLSILSSIKYCYNKSCYEGSPLYMQHFLFEILFGQIHEEINIHIMISVFTDYKLHGLLWEMELTCGARCPAVKLNRNTIKQNSVIQCKINITYMIHFDMSNVQSNNCFLGIELAKPDWWVSWQAIIAYKVRIRHWVLQTCLLLHKNERLLRRTRKKKARLAFYHNGHYAPCYHTEVVMLLSAIFQL